MPAATRKKAQTQRQKRTAAAAANPSNTITVDTNQPGSLESAMEAEVRRLTQLVEAMQHDPSTTVPAVAKAKPSTAKAKALAKKNTTAIPTPPTDPIEILEENDVSPEETDFKLSHKDRKPQVDLFLKSIAPDRFPRLSGSANFADWKAKFTRLARATNLLPFFTGTNKHLDQGSSKEWFDYYSLQAFDCLVTTCGDLAQESIRDLDDPELAWRTLEKHNKADGCNDVFEAVRIITDPGNGSPIALEQQVITIIAKLKAIDPDYILPGWYLNCLFVRNVGPAFETKVAILESDTSVVNPRNPMPFLELTKHFTSMEQRVTNPTNATLAVHTLPRKKHSGRSTEKCTLCHKTGHKNEIGPKGCWHRLENKEHKQAYESRKRSATNSGQPDAKARKVESTDFEQGKSIPTGMATLHMAPPLLDHFDGID
ncbi:hypothetical protein K402DRAFT_426077 [Aulographum hederae CBS 113979]|uniref:Uncharacterized protein n=1 Tax=Aulographum hederae CBS 113979 TaxID=1176131 RepID=A0A6G1GI52_9PEZI|nr:hypothetical protein K402DRAFT_426077 [Aulographum hederae CBS 113979]